MVNLDCQYDWIWRQAGESLPGGSCKGYSKKDQLKGEGPPPRMGNMVLQWSRYKEIRSLPTCLTSLHPTE